MPHVERTARWILWCNIVIMDLFIVWMRGVFLLHQLCVKEVRRSLLCANMIGQVFQEGTAQKDATSRHNSIKPSMQSQLHADAPGCVRLVISPKESVRILTKKDNCVLHKHIAGLRLLAPFVHMGMRWKDALCKQKVSHAIMLIQTQQETKVYKNAARLSFPLFSHLLFY